MSWFKIKSKEEKKVDLEQEVKNLNEQYSSSFNNLCLLDDKIIVYRKFYIKNNEILLGYETKNTLKNHINGKPWWLLKLQYGEDNFILKQRIKYLTLKESLEKFNFEIIEVNEK